MDFITNRTHIMALHHGDDETTQDSDDDYDLVQKTLKEFQSGTLDLSTKDLKMLPSQICNGLGASITSLLLDFNELTCLPHDFGEYCIHLKILSMIGNELKMLPPTLGNLNCLEELSLNENDISALPQSFCLLNSLRILKMTSNKLHHFPDEFGKLINLESLYVEENILETLPYSMGNLEKLKILELSENQLLSIPASLGKIHGMKVLNLCNNKLDNFPEELGELKLLEFLDLSGNHLESLPAKLKSTLSLKKLYCDRNRLVTIPDWISELKNVVEVSINDNQFHNQVISEKFGEVCQKLTYLDFGGNFMTKLPDSFGQLENLQELHLGSCIGELERKAFQNGNWITYLPTSFCQLTKLTKIHLDENLIQELPADFGNLINLEFIDLGQNALHELPDSFGNLKSLKICLLSKNKLQILPSSFGQLSSLQDLRLDNNLLEELPESFKDLADLKTLDLFNNKLIEVPSALPFFTKLVRMDLSENNFAIPWYEVPQIVTQARYPSRDPRHKNNWRGRPRQDLSMLDDQIIKMTTSSEVLDFEPPPKDLALSENALRDAARSNLSIWRTHSGPQKREKFIHRFDVSSRYRKSHSNSSDKEAEEENQEWNHICTDEEGTDDGDVDADDDYVPPIFQPKNRLNDTESKEEDLVTNTVTTEENWDDELEEVEDPYNIVYDYNYFNNIYQHPKPKTLEEAGYEVDDHLFLPYDIHSKPFVKDTFTFQMEDGQFDDAEEEES